MNQKVHIRSGQRSDVGRDDQDAEQVPEPRGWDLDDDDDDQEEIVAVDPDLSFATSSPSPLDLDQRLQALG